MPETTVSKEQIEARVIEALVEFGEEPEAVSLDARLDQLDVDSLDLVELAQIVEDEFGVRLEGDDLKGITTVGQVIDLVVSKSG